MNWFWKLFGRTAPYYFTIRETMLIRSLLEAEATRPDLPSVYAERTRRLIEKLDRGFS